MKSKIKQNKQENKKNKKNIYVPLKGLMGNAQDYHVYSMNLREKLVGFLLGMIGGFVVIYVFFRLPILSLIGGVFSGFMALKPFQNYLLHRRNRSLLLQFKDLLENLSASYSSGMNTKEAFHDAYQELKNVYGEGADITKEAQMICVGMDNNFIVEDLLNDFAQRSGLEDIESFASVFTVCNRQGANLKKVISDSRDMINDKIEIEMEIETMLSGNKNQLNIMMVMPLVIMISLSGMGGMSIITNNPVNVIVKIFVLALFSVSYFMGRKIVDIKL